MYNARGRRDDTILSFAAESNEGVILIGRNGAMQWKGARNGRLHDVNRNGRRRRDGSRTGGTTRCRRSRRGHGCSIAKAQGTEMMMMVLQGGHELLSMVELVD